MEIHCKFDEMVPTKALKNHPKNRNKHGQDQIERLAELYKFHGVRHPIIVSKLSGFIVAGHGRKLSAIRAGLDEFPVVYQDFESAEKEYAFLQDDNAIALWADLDLEAINLDLESFELDFNVNMLGIKNFNDIKDIDLEEIEETDAGDFNFIIKCKDLDEVKQLQDKFKTSGQKIKFEKALECLKLQ